MSRIHFRSVLLSLALVTSLLAQTGCSGPTANQHRSGFGAFYGSLAVNAMLTPVLISQDKVEAAAVFSGITLVTMIASRIAMDSANQALHDSSELSEAHSYFETDGAQRDTAASANQESRGERAPVAPRHDEPSALSRAPRTLGPPQGRWTQPGDDCGEDRVLLRSRCAQPAERACKAGIDSAGEATCIGDFCVSSSHFR